MPPIPTPPATFSAPVLVEVELVFAFTNISLLNVAVLVTDRVFAILTNPPIYALPPTPTPPATTNAPDIVLIEVAVFVMVVIPLILVLPPTSKIAVGIATFIP